MLTALNLAEPQANSVLRHVVLVKFKEDASKEQVQEVVDAFRALPSKIDAVKGFEFGTDNSPEMLADGFTHCFLLTFADEKGAMLTCHTRRMRNSRSWRFRGLIKFWSWITGRRSSCVGANAPSRGQWP